MHSRCVSCQVADQRAGKVNKLLGDVDNARIEVSCFKMLLKEETTAIPRRLGEAEAAAASEAEAEELLQARATIYLL